MWAFQTPINEVFCFGSIWTFTWHCIHLYFKGMTMNQVTCSGSHALPLCSLGLSPSRSMEPPGSPWELCAYISSGGIQSKMRNRPGDCNGSLSRLCSIILHTIVSPYATFFSVTDRNQLRAECEKAGVANGLLAGLDKAVTPMESRLLLHSAPLSWVHFWTPANSQLVVHYSAVMSSTQSRCSSVCVCVFFKLANLAVFP